MKTPISTYALRWMVVTYVPALALAYAIHPGGLDLGEWRVTMLVPMLVSCGMAGLIGLRRWLRG